MITSKVVLFLCLASFPLSVSAEEQDGPPLGSEAAALVSSLGARGGWSRVYKGAVVALSLDGEKAKLRPGELRDIFAKLKTVSSFELIDCDLKAADLAALQVENVRKLSINDSKMLDADLEPISRLVNLTRLSLTAREIDNNAMDSLKALQKLQSLNIFYTKVTGQGTRKLFDLKALERLSIKRGFYEQESADSYNGFAALTELSLTAEGTSPDFFDNLHPPALKVLYLYGEHESAPIGFSGYIQKHPGIDAKYFCN